MADIATSFAQVIHIKSRTRFIPSALTFSTLPPAPGLGDTNLLACHWSKSPRHESVDPRPIEAYQRLPSHPDWGRSCRTETDWTPSPPLATFARPLEVRVVHLGYRAFLQQRGRNKIIWVGEMEMSVAEGSCLYCRV